jgi:hypothetical protein
MVCDYLGERRCLGTLEQGFVVEQPVEQLHGEQATQPILEVLAHRAPGLALVEIDTPGDKL